MLSLPSVGAVSDGKVGRSDHGRQPNGSRPHTIRPDAIPNGEAPSVPSVGAVSDGRRPAPAEPRPAGGGDRPGPGRPPSGAAAAGSRQGPGSSPRRARFEQLGRWTGHQPAGPRRSASRRTDQASNQGRGQASAEQPASHAGAFSWARPRPRRACHSSKDRPRHFEQPQACSGWRARPYRTGKPPSVPSVGAVSDGRRTLVIGPDGRLAGLLPRESAPRRPAASVSAVGLAVLGQGWGFFRPYRVLL